MKISILTPSYNQAMYLEKNIQSIISQGIGDTLEHIVMDGGSRDGSVEILHKYPHLIWKSESDNGQSHALNKALLISTGEIIGWVNSDDMLPPFALSTVREYFIKHPDRNVVIGNMQIVDEQSRLLYTLPAAVIDFEGLLNGVQCVQQVSTFFRRQVFHKVGSFNESLHYCMDHEFFLRVAKDYKFYTIDADLGTFRIYPGSKTGTNKLGFIKDKIIIRRLHGGRFMCRANAEIFYMFVSEPFKRILWLRRLIRWGKRKNSDFIRFP